MLVASAWAVSSDASIGYEKEIAALEPDEWATTKIQPSPSEIAFDENAGENGPTSLFPGPTYMVSLATWSRTTGSKVCANQYSCFDRRRLMA